MPAPRFFKLALRLFYYQGAMAYRAAEAAEEEDRVTGPVSYDGPANVDRHNTAAAKHAARLAGIKEGEVQMVPFAALAGQHGNLMEHTKVTAG